MKQLAFILLIFLSFLVIPISFAQENFRKSENSILEKSEVVNKDYFAAGEKVTLSGVVNGDAYLAAGNIFVDGVINGDLLVAGGNIIINGMVTGNIRAAGGELQLNGDVGRNVSVVGGSVTVGKSGKIMGSLTVGAGEVQVFGPVMRGVNVGTGSLILGSGVGEDVVAGVGDLSLQPGASVSGKLTYFSNNPANVSSEASVSGGIIHNLPPQSARANSDKFWSSFSYGWNWYVFLTSLVVGSLLCWLLPNYTKNIVSAMVGRPWLSLGIGFLFLIVMPIVIVILFVTIIGIPFAILLSVLYMFLMFFARIFAAVFIGEWIQRKLNQGQNLLLAFILGLLILSVLRLIPVVGGLIGFVATLMGIGAYMMNKRMLFRELRGKKIL